LTPGIDELLRNRIYESQTVDAVLADCAQRVDAADFD